MTPPLTFTRPHAHHHSLTLTSQNTALVCVVPKDKLTVNGPVKKWKGIAASGNAVWRWFCGDCGSPIAHDPDAAPEIIALKGGSLDTEIKKTLKPVRFTLFLAVIGGKLTKTKTQDTEIWTVSKLPFCQEHLAKPFEHMPQ